MRNAKDILRHELIGLQCKVADAKNKCSAGIEGKIIDETMKTVKIITGEGTKVIPKKGTVLRVRLGSQSVDIEGDHLIGRPEDRIKKKISKW